MPPGIVREVFGFDKEEIHRLVPLLRLWEVPWHRGLKPSDEKALCVILARLSSPGYWWPMTILFGRSRPWLSMVFNDIAIFLVAWFGQLLRWHPSLTYERME